MHCSKQTSSFEYLVGADKNRLRQFHAKSIGGLQVDDKIELRGLRHRQIGWFRTLGRRLHSHGIGRSQADASLPRRR
jgi:hypothetical protein